MRRNTLITALVVAVTLSVVYVGCGFSPDLRSVDAFQAAQKAFDNATSEEDYLKAAAMYQNLLDEGIRSGAILYNQGNAFMKAGKRGRAVAAYLEAQRYLPTNPYLDANLHFALGALDVQTRRPLIEHILFWQNWISYGAKFFLAAFAAVLLFAAALLSLFLRRPLFQRLSIALAVVLLVLAFSAGYDWYRFDYIQHGVITQDEVVARKGNSATYDPAFTESLPEGSRFRVVERRGDWLLVTLPGKQPGWIQSDDAALF